MGYQGKATPHGFRATASTILNETGFRPDVIERQLAHIERNKVRAAYNRAEYLQDRREMMDWWGTFVEAAERGATVVPIGLLLHQRHQLPITIHHIIFHLIRCDFGKKLTGTFNLALFDVT